MVEINASGFRPVCSNKQLLQRHITPPVINSLVRGLGESPKRKEESLQEYTLESSFNRLHTCHAVYTFLNRIFSWLAIYVVRLIVDNNQPRHQTKNGSHAGKVSSLAKT